MDNVALWAFLACLFTWGMTAMGASLVLFFRSPHQKILNVMLGFAAGVMIAASFWSLLEPAVGMAEENGRIAFLEVSSGFLCGALFIWLSDKIVTWANRRVKGTEGDQSRRTRILLLVLSITLHNIPEGLAIGVAFGALSGAFSPEALTGALSITLGVALQNLPEGAAVSLPLRREGCTRTKSFLIGQASGMVEPVAAAFGAAAARVSSSLLPFLLSFAAGTMILVSVHELIPECQENNTASPYLATMGIVVGFAVMMVLDIALG